MGETFSRQMVGRAGFIAGATALLVGARVSPAGAVRSGERVLSLRRQGERVIRAPFTLDGRRIYRPGYYELCKALRDAHVDPTDGYVQVDPRLIDALWELQRRIDGRVITIHSGYRTPATNESVGGAIGSFHPRAMASDVSVDGLSPRQVGGVLLTFPASLVGGIGIYDDDGHVHVDTGPRAGRVWCNHDQEACAVR